MKGHRNSFYELGVIPDDTGVVTGDTVPVTTPEGDFE